MVNVKLLGRRLWAGRRHPLGGRQLLGVGLLSMGSLALEVVLTRIFSVKMWYHFAFMAISLALMGSAMAGVVLYALPQVSRPARARRWIGRLTVALALLLPLTFILYLNIPFNPVLMNRGAAGSADGPAALPFAVQLLWLLLIYLLLALPFFLSGFILSLALSGWATQAGKVYWADLTGASLGCLLSIIALEMLGGAQAVLCLAVVLALAGVIFYSVRDAPAGEGEDAAVSARRTKLFGGLTVPLAALLVVLALAVSNALFPWLRITVNKAGGAEAPPVYERWNAHSRVTVYEAQNYPFFWGATPAMWERTREEAGTWSHALLLIDAVAGTPIQRFDGDLEAVRFLRYDLTSFVYHLVERPETLVIGPGGGRDVLAALATDAPRVTAVEVNPAVVEAVRTTFADFAGHIYSRPDVEVVVADARGYIDRSPRRYDVIQASLIDTWAAGGSGAFALSENSLYTREAFRTYYEHLSERGYLTVSRWYLPQRPAETLRLVSTGMAGWEAAGVINPEQHVAVLAMDLSRAQTEGLSTTLFKRTPFTPAEVATLQALSEEMGFLVLYAPGVEPIEEVGHFIAHQDRAAFIRAYPLDISPATDDRPFFFNLLLLGDIFDPSLSGSGVYRTSMEAIFTLFTVIGVSLFLGALLMGILVWLSRRRGDLARPSVPLLGYFGALGIAFMMVEVPTIQKLTVYLGRPVYSLAVVLFALLLFSGLGSLWSSRWPVEALARRIQRVFLFLVPVMLLHPVLSSALLTWTLGWGLVARMAVAVGVLSLLGVFMGMPFPVGVRWAGLQRPGVVPWLWCVNGVASVLGSALATALAIHVGFRWTMVLAALTYAAAGVLLRRELRLADAAPAWRLPRLAVRRKLRRARPTL